MRIGELARHAGCTPKAIRLYEARGLLGPVARAGTYRRYGAQDVERVLRIRQALALGFRLAELTGLRHMDTPEGWTRLADLLRARRHAVESELARLQALRGQLAALEGELQSCDLAPGTGMPAPCVLPAAAAA